MRQIGEDLDKIKMVRLWLYRARSDYYSFQTITPDVLQPPLVGIAKQQLKGHLALRGLLGQE
jgi:hypothetical protein